MDRTADLPQSAKGSGKRRQGVAGAGFPSRAGAIHSGTASCHLPPARGHGPIRSSSTSRRAAASIGRLPRAVPTAQVIHRHGAARGRGSASRRNIPGGPRQPASPAVAPGRPAVASQAPARPWDRKPFFFISHRLRRFRHGRQTLPPSSRCGERSGSAATDNVQAVRPVPILSSTQGC